MQQIENLSRNRAENLWSFVITPMTIRHGLKRPLLAGVLAWLLGGPLLGQGSGSIVGNVETAQGEPIPQAAVTLTQANSSLRLQVTVGALGRYRFGELAGGTYQLQTVAAGYATVRREAIQLASGNTLEVNIQLEPVQMAQSIRQLETRAERERNPNIFIRKIDLYALRDPLRSRGIDPALLEHSATQSHYGADLGAPLRQIVLVEPGSRASVFHGSVYEAHQNSVLNARPFFNVGPLRSSHRNQFGFALSGPVAGDKLSFSTSVDFIRDSGFVNGNVRVPTLEERVPMSNDPETDQIIAALLAGFPPEEPNLPNVTPRQLNTNAERVIRNEDWNLRLDYAASDKDHLAFQYALTNYGEDPFEFVAGQNPETDLRPQTLSTTYVHTVSPASVLRTSLYFDRFRGSFLPTERFRSLLQPLGLPDVPDIDFGGNLGDVTQLGPGTQYPRLRAQNRFGGRAAAALVRGRHRWQMGVRLIRVQLNDLQSDNTRGEFVFNGFENFLQGTPTQFTITQGNLYRGFRHWESAFYFQDAYQLRPNFTLSFGLRYELTTSPTEVNGLTDVGYSTDTNNFAPHLGFAWRPADGLVVRGGYGISFGQIFPGTFQLARFNPPAVRTINIQNPSLVNPLQELETRGELERSELSLLSADLVAPYAHQYNLVIQKSLLNDLSLEVGYIGNRTLKTFFPFVSNRAEPVPGDEPTTENINTRRPDSEFLNVRTIINSGISYYDGLRFRLTRRFGDRFAFDLGYVFSKNVSSGFDFAATLNREAAVQVSQNNEDFQADMRSLASFDTRHAWRFNYTYELPFNPGAGGLSGWLTTGWRVTGTTEIRSGGWFDITTSSDAPQFGNVDGVRDDRPNIINPAILGMAVDDPDTSTSILNPDFFNTDIAVGGRGNLGLRVFRRDGVNNTNLAIAKTFFLPSDKNVEFRTDFFNLFNQPMFTRAGDVFPSAVFGKIVDTRNKGRALQFMLRMSF